MRSLVSKEVSGVRVQRAELTGFLEKFKGNELFHALVDWQSLMMHQQHVRAVTLLSVLEQSPEASLSLLANTSHSTPSPRACLEVLSLVSTLGAFSWHLHRTYASASVGYTVLFGYSFFFLWIVYKCYEDKDCFVHSRIPTMTQACTL